jgi:quercetin dioxygenase-like cupin family protein
MVNVMSNEPGRCLIGPDDGKVISNPIGGRMVIKLTDGDTNGAYSIHHNVIPAHSPGPRPHVHRYHDEVFYVLDGEITVQIGSQTIKAPTGSFVLVPRGESHQPSNPNEHPATVLLFFSPSGMGNFFSEVAERRLPLQKKPTDTEIAAELHEFTQHYGYEFSDES